MIQHTPILMPAYEIFTDETGQWFFEIWETYTKPAKKCYESEYYGSMQIAVAQAQNWIVEHR